MRNKALSFKIKAIDPYKLQDLLQQKEEIHHSFYTNVDPKKVPLSSLLPSSTATTTSLKFEEHKFTNFSLVSDDFHKPNQIKKNNNFDVEGSIIKYLGSILEYVMKDAYGDLWESIVLYKPPWSAIEVLKCFKKHWIAVFMDKFSDEVQKTIKQIHLALESKAQIDIHQKLLFLYRLFKHEPYKSIVSYALSNDENQLEKEKTCSSRKDLTKQINLEKEPRSQKDTFMSSFNQIQEAIIDIGKYANCAL